MPISFSEFSKSCSAPWRPAPTSRDCLKFATSGASLLPLMSETTLERCPRFLLCYAKSSASLSLFSCSSLPISASRVEIISESAAVLLSRVMISFSRMAASSSSSRYSTSMSFNFYSSCSFSFWAVVRVNLHSSSSFILSFFSFAFCSPCKRRSCLTFDKFETIWS